LLRSLLLVATECDVTTQDLILLSHLSDIRTNTPGI